MIRKKLSVGSAGISGLSESGTKKRKRRGERADGLIQVSASVGLDENGKRVRKYFYGRSRAEAEARHEAFLAANKIRSKYSIEITVSEWVDEVLAQYRGRVHDAYKGSDAVPFHRLKQDLGEMRVVDVIEADLQESLNELEGKSFSTVEKYYRAIQVTFKRARANRIIMLDPSELLIKPRSVRGSHRALDREEVDHILANWNAPGVRCGLWVMIMLLSGLRRGELVALDWSAVSLANRTIAVRQTAVLASNKTIIEPRAKTDAGIRVIPLCDALFAALSSVPKVQRKGFVCARSDASALTEQAFRKGFSGFVASLERLLNGYPASWAGVRRDLWSDEQKEKWDKRKRFSFRSHDLRHTFATMLYDAGIAVKAAQYFLGHSDIKITLNLYTHFSREREVSSRLMMVDYFSVS